MSKKAKIHFTNEHLEKLYDNKFDLAKAAIRLARHKVANNAEIQLTSLLADLEKAGQQTTS